MFIIFSKEKIRTYIISLITVISLFIFVLANNSKTSSENNIQASANIFTNNTENYDKNDANILKIEDFLENN